MARGAPRGDPSGVAPIEIRDAVGRELVEGAALLAESLSFGPRDAIPAWLMQTTGECGGLALGAFVEGSLAGFSYALPGHGADGPFLFSCGLAVVPEHRSQGIGQRLKRHQRERALAHGYRSIRWTADPLSAAALHLYLSVLGARLTAYRAGLYDVVRPADGIPQDDVEIVWDLDGAGRAQPAPDAECELVEIPARRAALSAEEALHWRLRVREAATPLLARGWIGTAVELDRAGGRCWLRFRPPAG
jgi:predicted GNAT superfamily acetyltransferase